MWPHRHLDVANIRWQKGRPARVLWLGPASSSRQLTKQCGDSINMHRAGRHTIITTYFYWNSAWGFRGLLSQPAEHTPWKPCPQGFRSSWKPWKEQRKYNAHKEGQGGLVGLELPQRSGNVGCNPGFSPSLVDDLWSPECFLSAKCETSICLAFPGYGISFQLENLPGQEKKKKKKDTRVLSKTSGHLEVRPLWQGHYHWTYMENAAVKALPKTSISLYFPSVVHSHLILFWKSQSPSKIRIMRQILWNIWRSHDAKWYTTDQYLFTRYVFETL